MAQEFKKLVEAGDNLEGVKKLIESFQLGIGENVEVRDCFTPLTYSAYLGRYSIVKYLVEELRVPVDQIYMEIGYPRPSVNKKSAIVHAAENGHANIVKFLIVKYANVSKINMSRVRNIAIRNMIQNVSLVQLLFRKESEEMFVKSKLEEDIKIKELKETMKNKEIECKKKIDEQKEQLDKKEREWVERFKVQEDEWKVKLEEKQEQLENKETEWGKRFEAQEHEIKKRLKEQLNGKEEGGSESEPAQKVEGKKEESKKTKYIDDGIRKYNDADALIISEEFLKQMDFDDIDHICKSEESEFTKKIEVKKCERKKLESILKKAENRMFENLKILDTITEEIAILKKGSEGIESLVKEEQKRIDVLMENLERNERDVQKLEAEKRERLTSLKLIMDQKKETREIIVDGRGSEPRFGGFRQRYELVIDDIKALTECQVCQESNDARKLQCENVHLICAECLEKMANNSCPLCRMEVRFEARNVNKICKRISADLTNVFD